MNKRCSIAAVILTKDEELTIATCIRSCTFADEIIVLDSVSTDKTVSIAKQLNATVHARPFDDYAAQRNASLSLAKEHEWAFMIDADEQCSAALAKEIRQTAEAAEEATVLFRVRRKDMFFGTWIRHASGYPHWFPRLVRPTRVTVTRPINEDVVIDGGEGTLSEHLIHHPFVKGIAHWIDRHNRYSTLEARQLVVEQDRASVASNELNSGYGEQRRRIKQIFYRLPCRSLIAFFVLYFVRMGFLDGVAGYRYARLRAMYEYMITIKQAELRTQDQREQL
ncbi:MAG: glycosyltransferase family 2 protein [Planctomycetota bacterium]